MLGCRIPLPQQYFSAGAPKSSPPISSILMEATDYRSWKERLAAAGGHTPGFVVYTRKSTESQERQVASHEQQVEEIQKHWEIDVVPEWHWCDSQSGTTFERPGFQDLLAFCKAHPRKNEHGRILIYDPSRFGRKLDEEGQPDIMGFFNAYSAFEQLGWELHFVTLQRTGNMLADVMGLAVYAYAASLYSTTLSKNVRRGRIHHSSLGYWTAGAAPWGTIRMDGKTGRVLPPGEQRGTGGGGIILIGDEPVLKIWARVARAILGGASYDKVGAMLFDEGVRGPRGGCLGHRSIRNLLANPALVGRVSYRDEDRDGKRSNKTVKAKWEPLVDVKLFAAVQRELDERASQPRNRKRKKREAFPIRVTCAACGVDYTGGRLAQSQGRGRVYSHTKPARSAPAAADRFAAGNCKVWSLDAEELETKIRDLIVAQRTTAEFEDEVRSLILERDELRKTADEAVATARQRVEEAQRKYAWIARKVSQVQEDDADEDEDDALVKELKLAKAAIKHSKSELEAATQFARSKEDAWEELSKIISDSRNLAAAWDKAGPEERKVLFDYWLLDVLIVVEPIPGMKRANKKTALVTLRTAPNAPKCVDLDSQSALARAERIASATSPSDSASSRSRSAANAAGVATTPSAPAACTRTSGSGFDSADANTGTSSSPPTRPSTTAELRCNPRSLARFNGDPLNAAENSDCDIESKSRASDRASRSRRAGRGAKASSRSGSENLWANGHTS